jgi:DNA topoisomerase-1
MTDNDTYTLIICEKPQAAMKIAYALAEIAPVKRNIAGVPYWEVNQDDKKFIVASAVGHLFGLVQKKEKRSGGWPVFDIDWQPNTGFSEKYLNVLKQLATKASDFIVACDYDVEGELIGFNVLRFICNKKDAKRMKFSTLTKYDLNESYKELMNHIDFGQAYAGETRHYLDWFYGINLSRALMQAIKQTGSFRIMSIGRVQGPSLKLVVDKELKIQDFKSEPYWNISLLISNPEQIQTEVHYKKDIFEKEETEKFLKFQGKTGNAITEKKETKLYPFPPFDLTSLQIESYKYIGLSPAQTLAIAQKLYLQGLISYPRTSSQKLPFSIGLKRVLSKLERLYPEFTKLVSRKRPIEGRKSDPAHPAIFPTGEEPKKINTTEKRVYELIVKRFLSCFAQEAIIEQKKIKIKIEKYEFSNDGKTIKEKGWLDIYPFRIQEKELPNINGEVKVKEVKIQEKETKPPKRYSQASLIHELEKRNLGTKATRANIIETLYKRGYITDRQIQATKIGINVVLSLEKNCPMILDEKLTRKFEQEMELIKKEKSGEEMKKKEEKILDEAREILKKIAKQFKKQEKVIGKILAEAQQEAREEERKRNTLFQCPKCKKGQLIILRSKRGKRFAACNEYPKCKTTFPLPQYGLIKVTDEKCECGLLRLQLIKKSKPPWNFCMNPIHYMGKENKKEEKKEKKIKKTIKTKKTKKTKKIKK